jgi:hypothetical protein
MSVAQKVPGTSGSGKFRSQDKTLMVREYTDQKGVKQVFEALLPHGRGWNSGEGVIDWINMGWQTSEEYKAVKHRESVAAEQEDAIKKLKAERAELESGNAQKKSKKNEQE